MSAVIHRNAVRALLISPETEILMIQLRDPETARRFWIAPGGGLRDEEPPEAGLRRELSEEVGLGNFTPGPLVWKRQHTFNWAGTRVCQRERFYAVRTERFEPVMTDSYEAGFVEQFRWWTLPDIEQSAEDFTPRSIVRIVRRYVEQGPPGEQELEFEVLID